MHPQTDTIPKSNQDLLRSAGFPAPMPISALENFESLEDDQIREKIDKHTTASQEHDKNPILKYDSGAITGKNHFSLTLDQATVERHDHIHISNCNHFTIRSFLPAITPSRAHKFFIEIIDCKHFYIEGITCFAGRNMLFITDSSYFTIKNCTCLNAEGSGIIINNGNGFRVTECIFNNNLSAGILVIGNSYNGEIRDCSCTCSRGYFNHDAAIHFCSTSEHVLPSHIPERCHEPIPITGKKQRPHHILIKNCFAAHCRAQGMYLEGAVNCIIEDNILIDNNKEGICFDWGSCYNIFRRNIVSLNGERSKLSAEEIKADFIARYPLLDDESSSMKLPGISLDNACMNLVQNNKITNNYGGGIKMIRTALFNNISSNQILYNAIGVNPYVPYFHGITALGLGAINNEFDSSRPPLLDFMPSILNTIADNTIVEHWQPIFSDRVSSNNYIYGNITPQREQTLSRLTTAYNRVKGFLKRFTTKLTKKLKQ